MDEMRRGSKLDYGDLEINVSEGNNEMMEDNKNTSCSSSQPNDVRGLTDESVEEIRFIDTAAQLTTDVKNNHDFIDQDEGRNALTVIQELMQERALLKDALQEAKASALKDAELEFGKKRALLMDLFRQKEIELQAAQENLRKTQAELDNMSAVAEFAESSKRDELNLILQNYHAELASLQHIMQTEQTETGESVEVNDQGKVEEATGIPEKSQSADGFLVSMVSRLQRRVATTMLPADTEDGEDLEHSMKRAQQDTQALKAVVVPLEKEIEDLKSRLAKSVALNDQLEEQLKAMGDVKQLCESLKLEKSSRVDLEMHVSVLNTQKTVLLQEQQELQNEIVRLNELPVHKLNKCYKNLFKIDEEIISQLTDHADAELVKLYTEKDMPRKELLKSIEELSSQQSGRMLGDEDDSMSINSAFLALSGEDLEIETSPDNSFTSSPMVLNTSGACGGSPQKTEKYCGQKPYEELGHHGVHEESKRELQISALEGQLSIERAAVAKMKNYTGKLEEMLKTKAEEMEKQIKRIGEQLLEAEQASIDSGLSWSRQQVEVSEQLTLLGIGQQHANEEMMRLVAENESLLGLHATHSSLVQAENINLPDGVQELQETLLMTRDELVAARVQSEHAREALQRAGVFAKDQLKAEQQERDKMERELSQELEDTLQKLGEVERSHTNLQKNIAETEDVKISLRQCEATLLECQATKNAQLQESQQTIEKLQLERMAAQDEVRTVRKQIQSLQSDMANSVATQRDFVKLSQSLQIQLEEIRSGQHEVRWQHEEDVDSCKACKQSFTATRQRIHCRHCGRIFCHECLVKTVNSGPNARPSKVCNICHTILVKDATPYFSSDPPSTPD